MNYRYISLMRCKWAFVVLAVFLLATFAFATDSIKSSYVPNRLLVKFSPGTTEAERNAAADKLGAKIVGSLAVDNAYILELIPSRGMTVESALTRAADISSIVIREPDYLEYPREIPNDTLWNRLWGMQMINAPTAWNLEKGKASVIVAVLDTGFDLTHPDLRDRFLPGRDTADNDNDPSPGINAPSNGEHGTHVAGIIAAQGNNNAGVCGVCWNGVKILPVKVFPSAGGGAPMTASIAGLEYARVQGAKVVNMSLGGYVHSELRYEKIKQLVSEGITICASAGNDATNLPSYPCGYPEVVSVAALDKDEDIATYSNWGKIDIAAPGGEGFSDSDDVIWSTILGGQYGGRQGTSMACPYVSGAAALLLSYGVAPHAVVGKLYRGARAPKAGILDPLRYGHGVLDVARSMVLTGDIKIISPGRGEALATSTPTFKVTTNLIDKDSIKVYIDYTDVNKDGSPDDETENVVLYGATMELDPNVQWNNDTEGFTFVWPVGGQQPFTPGTHTICITGNGSAQADPALVKDWMVFFIQPKVVPAGRYLLSIPYPLPSDVTPYQLFGSNNFQLARYIPARNTYAKINYPGEADDMEAWYGSGVRPVGATTDTPPAGLGFWVVFKNNTPIVINGVADTTKAYNITLTRGVSGWNMIGNPFPFPVPWESVKVTYQGKTVTLNEAIAAKWIRSSLYRYTKSGYTCQNPPDAVLVPWEGHWVKLLPDNPERINDTLVLQIPPISSGAIVETPSGRVSTGASRDSWSLRLEARIGDVIDANNHIGVNSRAADGYDNLDYEKPPMANEDIQLAFVHDNWGNASGRYATDYRSGIGTGKSWEFQVTTDIPNKDVSIAWPDISAVPKAYNLILEDLDTGNSAFMRTRSSYTYNSGATPGVRRFKLRVEPASSGNMMITNVSINRTKASGVSIGYTISREARVVVRIRDSRNKLIRTLDGNKTRAAGINATQWDCASESGNPVTSGLYLAEIIATGPDGEVAKATRPILVR